MLACVCYKHLLSVFEGFLISGIQHFGNIFSFLTCDFGSGRELATLDVGSVAYCESICHRSVVITERVKMIVGKQTRQTRTLCQLQAIDKRYLLVSGGPREDESSDSIDLQA